MMLKYAPNYLAVVFQNYLSGFNLKNSTKPVLTHQTITKQYEPFRAAHAR
jgi:hypothetical protein